jgi:asparagine synthase (glutamine-hydrolysing)
VIAAVLRVDGVEVEPSLPDRMLGVWRPGASDAEGTWVQGAVAIGETRLWLTEEPRPRPLPVRDEQRDLVLVWDGRLDNGDDLLTSLGSGRSETAPTDEVLVLDAYARWGVTCVERLLGDFAFILWDGRSRRLFAARDHMGVRPLHYAFDGRSLVVASRIGQVLEGTSLERRLNEPMVADFLADNQNPAETLFRNVWRVPAAHVLQCDRGARAPRVWRYWDLRERPTITYRSDGEYVEHFHEVAGKAVNSRLRGPGLGPIGIMQSGGYDSSTIACIASESIDGAHSSTGRVAAFTAVFDELPEEDERRYVEALVAHCGFEAHYVTADEMWTFRDATPHAGSWDEPFEGPFDGLIAGLFDRAQQEGVRVLLDGIGGDTLFAGSPYYLFDLLLDRRWVALSREVKRWPLSEWPALTRSYVLAPLVRRCPPCQARGVPEWMSPDFAARCETESRLRAADPPRRFRRPSQQKTYEAVTQEALPNTMLWLQSEALLRGIDLRHPVLDVRMIDFFMRIPSSQRAQGRHNKMFIRNAMKDSFPQIITDQSLNVGKYLGPSLDRGLLERWGACLGGRCHLAELGYVDPVLLQAAFARYLERERDYVHARKLALVLRLEKWLRYLLGEPD